MTLFSFEVPFNHLGDFEELQDFHFSVSTFYENTRYKAYMCEQARKGLKSVWLDNGYNERMKADDPNKLAKLAFEVGANKIVSPDSPKWEPIQIFDSYFDMLHYFPSSKMIVVVKDEIMLKMGLRFKVTNFAYSYWVRMGKTLEEMMWATRCHFLGLVNCKEIRELQPPSCDTSMPIKIALRGWSLRKWIEKDCPHIHTKDIYGEFFFKKMTTKQIDLAINNIIMLKEVCNGQNCKVTQ